MGQYIRQRLVELVQQDQRQADGKYHVSDLINPRFAFFNKKEGNYLAATPDDAYMFLPGIAFHKLIQEAIGNEMAEKEVVLGKDIVGTVDIMGLHFMEIKTSRKYTIPEEPDAHYVEQFEKYLAMAGRTSGHIVVVYFVAGRTFSGGKPSTLEIRSWKVEITQDEIRDIKAGLLLIRDGLNKAMQTNNHKVLPLCWEFKCASIYQGKTSRICPFYEKCQPEGRYPINVFVQNKERQKKANQILQKATGTKSKNPLFKVA